MPRRQPYRRFFKGVFCWTLFSAATWGHQRAKILDGSYKAFSSSICYWNWFACYEVVLFGLNWFLNVLVLYILRYSISDREKSFPKQIENLYFFKNIQYTTTICPERFLLSMFLVFPCIHIFYYKTIFMKISMPF